MEIQQLKIQIFEEKYETQLKIEIFEVYFDRPLRESFSSLIRRSDSRSCWSSLIGGEPGVRKHETQENKGADCKVS